MPSMQSQMLFSNLLSDKMKFALCLLALLQFVYTAAIAEEERSVHFGGTAVK